VIIVATFDWNRVKPTINEKVSGALGRPFAINGDLSVQWRREPSEPGWRRWVPWPWVTADNIRLGNTDWAREPDFARLDRAVFAILPLPLLANTVTIRNIQLTRPWADLQRLPDGRANWTFEMDSSGEPSPWVIDVNAVGFDQGRVGYQDAMTKADLEVMIDPLGKPVPYTEIVGAQSRTAKGDDVPTEPAQKAADSQDAKDKPGTMDRPANTAQTGANGQASAKTQVHADAGKSANAEAAAPPPPEPFVFGWKVAGKYDNQPLKGDGKIGGMVTLRDGMRPFPVQADVRVGRTRGQIAGTVTDPLKFGGLDLDLDLSGASMADLFPLIGVTLPDTPPYRTSGHLIARLQRAEGPLFEYRRFTGAVGKSDIGGTLSFAMGQPRPKLTGTLRSRQLRLEDLGPLVGVQSGGAAKPSDQAKPQPSAKALPVNEFRTERWADMDADVKLAAGRIIHGSKLPLSDLDTHVIMDAGRLTLDPLRFGMAGGTLSARIDLDGARSPMAGRATLRARRLQLKQLFADAEAMQKSLGQMSGDAVIAGRGNSVSALMASADGEVKALINDGVISRSLMEIAGLNVANYVVTKMFGDDEVKINCGAADLIIKDGLLRTNVFVFDTENALIQIDGSANFKNEALDLDITPRSKGFRVFSFRSPLYVEGTFKNPDAGVKVLPLAARGAGMVALGALLTPVAGVLALIAPSAGEEANQCGALLQELKGAPKVPARK